MFYEELEQEIRQTKKKLSKLQKALKLLRNVNTPTSVKDGRGQYVRSEQWRNRISESQTRRWARVRAEKNLAQ